MPRKKIIDDGPETRADTDTNEQETVFRNAESPSGDVNYRECLENYRARSEKDYHSNPGCTYEGRGDRRQGKDKS